LPPGRTGRCGRSAAAPAEAGVETTQRDERRPLPGSFTGRSGQGQAAVAVSV
jgi:hypothetical protein